MSVKAEAAGSTRVLIVTASAERRLALRSLLTKERNLEVAEASPLDFNSALRQVKPGVVLIEVDPRLTDSADVILGNGSAVVLLADNPEPDWIAHQLASGVAAVLRRDAREEQIAAAARAAATGLIAVEPDILRGLLRPQADSVELEPGEEELTPRESEVLRMMTAGLSNREIASTLGISEHTVKFHITSILGKLGTSSRTEAVTEGLRRGLVLL